MGKLEKVVVLSVLFLIALILVVSLTTDDPLKKEHAALLGEGSKVAALPKPAETTPVPATSPAPAPLQGESKTDAGAPAPSVATSNVDPKAPPSNPNTLLNLKVDSAPANPAVTLPPDALLKTSAGLTSFSNDRMLYTWSAGDTWLGVADRLYGNPTKFTMLRRANDDRENVEVGNKIMVPIRDEDTPALVVKEISTPKEPIHTSTTSKTPKTGPGKTAAALPAVKVSGGGKLHVVKDGESLWKIAKAELGEGSRWKEIFEANRDKLTTPEALHNGMSLRIP